MLFTTSSPRSEAPPADISVMLTVKNVSKVFDTLDNGVQSVRALDDVSLDVKRGRIFPLSVRRVREIYFDKDYCRARPNLRRRGKDRN